MTLGGSHQTATSQVCVYNSGELLVTFLLTAKLGPRIPERPP